MRRRGVPPRWLDGHGMGPPSVTGPVANGNPKRIPFPLSRSSRIRQRPRSDRNITASPKTRPESLHGRAAAAMAIAAGTEPPLGSNLGHVRPKTDVHRLLCVVRPDPAHPAQGMSSVGGRTGVTRRAAAAGRSDDIATVNRARYRFRQWETCLIHTSINKVDGHCDFLLTQEVTAAYCDDSFPA